MPSIASLSSAVEPRCCIVCNAISELLTMSYVAAAKDDQAIAKI